MIEYFYFDKPNKLKITFTQPEKIWNVKLEDVQRVKNSIMRILKKKYEI